MQTRWPRSTQAWIYGNISGGCRYAEVAQARCFYGCARAARGPRLAGGSLGARGESHRRSVEPPGALGVGLSPAVAGMHAREDTARVDMARRRSSNARPLRVHLRNASFLHLPVSRSGLEARGGAR